MYKYALWQNISEFANRDSSKNYNLPIGRKLANSQITKHLYPLWQNIREFANRDPSKNYNLPIGRKLANSQIAKHNVRGQGGCRCVVKQARPAVRCDAVGRAPRKNNKQITWNQPHWLAKTRRRAGTGSSTVGQVDVPEPPDAEKN